MATRVKFSSKGFEEYLEKLAAAGRDVDKVAAQALRAGAQVAREGMKRRVRKDTHNLEAHIRETEVKRDGNYSYIEIGVLDADADTARYANAQEYGDAQNGSTPYIRPTMDEDARDIKAAMKREYLASMEGGD